MNKKMREITNAIESLHSEAVELLNAQNVEGAEAKLQEIENKEREYKVAEKLYANEKEEVTEEVVNKVNAVDKVKAFATAIKTIRNTMTEGSNADGGYTVPEDVQTDINEYKTAKASLLDLVDVEKVSTNKGSRTFKKRSQQTGFTKVGETGKIGANATPQFERINYEIEKYAGYLPVANELFEDSDANIYKTLVEWLGDESRVTANKLILEQVATKEAVDLKGLDGIKKALNVTLGQAFKPTSKIVTNDDGLQYLDTLKDLEENYKLSVSPADPMKLVLTAGATVIPLEVLPNADLPTVENKVPFIVGDLKEGIKFWDRQRTNIITSNTAVAGELNAFEQDLTLFRAIEREDVTVKDAAAFVNGYITVTESL